MKKARRTVTRPKTPVRTRTGGRSARVVDEVLRATIEEVGRVGYPAMRVEEVALRSGVNKTTIYRRWPDKIKLVTAAIERAVDKEQIDDTGDLERDFIDHFVHSLERMNTPHVRGMIRLIQADRHGPEIEAVIQRHRETHIAARRARIESAIAAGQLPPNTDAHLLQTTLTNTIFTSLFRHSEVVTPRFVEQVVRLVVAGARALGET